MDAAVESAAMRAFYEQELHRLTRRGGVLFFISLMERTVWVVADKDVYERISHVGLKEISQSVSRGIREGRACPSLCEAIGEIGRVLPSTPVPH
jgi:putative membrane protein